MFDRTFIKKLLGIYKSTENFVTSVAKSNEKILPPILGTNEKFNYKIAYFCDSGGKGNGQILTKCYKL